MEELPIIAVKQSRSLKKDMIQGDFSMAIEKVKEYFRKYGMENRIQEFAVSSATVELAAQALHCEPCRIAKTL